MHLTAERWAANTGPIYRFDLGPRRIVVVSDADVLNELLPERPDGFRRWSEIEAITVELWGTPGVFAAEGDDWRRSRRLAVTALNSNHLQSYFEIVSACADRLRRRLEPAAREGRPIEIGEALSSFTVDASLRGSRSATTSNTLERGDNELQGHLHRLFQITNRRPFCAGSLLALGEIAGRSRIGPLAGPSEAGGEGLHRPGQAADRGPAGAARIPENFLEGIIAAQENEGKFSDEEITANVTHPAACRRGHDLAHDGLGDLVAGVDARHPEALG